MKNLGVSIEDLSEPKNAGIIASLRALPFSTILEQIEKLIHHVRVINDDGLIHGDIRTTNIMVKNDGTLTLIDFDWLLPQDTFYSAYYGAFGFYSNPPESILLSMNRVYEVNKDKDNNDVYTHVLDSTIFNYVYTLAVISAPTSINTYITYAH